MAIQSIQANFDTNKSQSGLGKKKVVKPYMEAEGAIDTSKQVKPLPPQGYLVKDDFASGIKYFFKDMAYDAKAVKDGFQGKANDHQLGRLNDVGLRLGGIGIATYLASQTTNPRARLMEYVGLGAFLTSMAIYPKLAINGPAKLVHGFDIDKEYVDDQGRKKSVFQDTNYIPYDMYLGEYSDEDLDKIGDRLDIPKDWPNRKEVVKAQMRKIATQNNTMWMLTAGLATPAMTALMCCGIENFIAGPGIESTRNSLHNKRIAEIFKKTESMGIGVDDIKILDSSFAKEMSGLTNALLNKELTKAEVEAFAEKMTAELDFMTKEALQQDIINLIKGSKSGQAKYISLNPECAENIIKTIKASFGAEDLKKYGEFFVPTKEELESVFKSVLSEDLANGRTSVENKDKLVNAFKDLLNKKLENYESKIEIPERHKGNEEATKKYLERLSHRLDAIKQKTVGNMQASLLTQESTVITESVKSELDNVAKIIGDFREIKAGIDKTKDFKFAHVEETVLGRYYLKFESVFAKELGLTSEQLRKARESADFAYKLLDEKFVELCKDDVKYENVMKKLGKVISDMEVSLHGKNADSSAIQDIFGSIENLYNKTALRLGNLGKNFLTTSQALVKEDLSTLRNGFTSKLQVFDYLDGLIPSDIPEFFSNETTLGNSNFKPSAVQELGKATKKGVGSSKRVQQAQIVERYQGARNSFYRLFSALEFYKRAQNPEEIKKFLSDSRPENIEAVIKLGKETLIKGCSTDFALKMFTQNNPILYLDTFNAMFPDSVQFNHRFIDKFNKSAAELVKDKGYVSNVAKEALESVNEAKMGNVLDRFQYYITRFRRVMSNSVNFMYDSHIMSDQARKIYHPNTLTPEAEFNLLAQNPLGLLQDTAKNTYATPKWFKIIGGIAAATFAVAIGSQFLFGKKPEYLKKQVNNDKN